MKFAISENLGKVADFASDAQKWLAELNRKPVDKRSPTQRVDGQSKTSETISRDMTMTLNQQKTTEKDSLIVEFSTMHRLKLSKDGCGDLIIKGKKYVGSRPEDACHIFEGYNTGLGVSLNFKSVKRWNRARRTLQDAGAQLRQNGDMDGIFVFNPADKPQVDLVLSLVRPRQKRILSDDQRRVLADRMAVARNKKAA